MRKSTLVPPYSGRSTRSPALTELGTSSPFSLRRPGPAATTVASRTLKRKETIAYREARNIFFRMKSLTLPCDFSGSIIPPLVLTSAANLSTRTRSWRGWKVFKRSPFWKKKIIFNSNPVYCYVQLFLHIHHAYLNVQLDKKRLTARRLTARNMIVEDNERITTPRTGMVNKRGRTISDFRGRSQ